MGKAGFADVQLLHALILVSVTGRRDRLGRHALLLDDLTLANVSVDDVDVANNLGLPLAVDLTGVGFDTQVSSAFTNGMRELRRPKTDQPLDFEHARALALLCLTAATDAHGVIAIHRASAAHPARRARSGGIATGEGRVAWRGRGAVPAIIVAASSAGANRDGRSATGGLLRILLLLGQFRRRRRRKGGHLGIPNPARLKSEDLLLDRVALLLLRFGQRGNVGCRFAQGGMGSARSAEAGNQASKPRTLAVLGRFALAQEDVLHRDLDEREALAASGRVALAVELDPSLVAL